MNSRIARLYALVFCLLAGVLASCSDGGPVVLLNSSEATNSVPMVEVRLLDDQGRLTAKTNVARLIKTDLQWRRQLSTQEYEVARGKGTEPAFCGTLTDAKKPGIYYCVCCHLPLFTSDSKFHSGTGWPSFFAPVAPENVVLHPDKSFGMDRTEILCARCDAHLGHVFGDGPQPTGQRYCINSVSLVFKKDSHFKESSD